MAFQRTPIRQLPDGTSSKVFPFHISLEGLESNLLCRDEEDYDHLEKSFFLSAWKNNCLIVMEIAMSNHGHGCVLAPNMTAALRTGEMVKKRQSQYLSWKYGEKSILSRSRVDVRYLDSDWYVRNALAYIPRNAEDANCRIEDYRWSSYRGMFVQGRSEASVRKASALSKREMKAVFRTHEDLSAVPWLLNIEGGIEPASACDWQYLESAFNHEQAYFLKTIGSLNKAEMVQQLTLNERLRHTDTEMLAILVNLADKWFHKTIMELTPEMKSRLLPYVYRCYRTTIPQLARCLQLPKDAVSSLIPVRKRQTPPGVPE